MTIAQLKKNLAAALAALQSDSLTGDELKNKYLGKKGLFNALSAHIKTIDDKKSAGQLLNEYKEQFESIIATNQKSTIKTPNSTLDLTLPPLSQTRGHLHPITQAIEEITQIFTKIGFVRTRYPEVDTDFYAFESLNMQPNHPARDEWETFFVDVPGQTATAPTLVLTPHTSNGQVHEMQRLGEPPVRMINIGRCYRRQQDATHTQVFHQFEGLVIDKDISIADLKGVLDYFAHEFYGEGVKSRIRPFHFQFTEPSFEVDFSCHICGGTGSITVDSKTQKCKLCKSGWHEVGGAGMVHPNVLKAGGFDPDKVSGFAFGWGVERTYTLQKDLGIDDIRGFYNNEIKFLEQF